MWTIQICDSFGFPVFTLFAFGFWTDYEDSLSIPWVRLNITPGRSSGSLGQSREASTLLFLGLKHHKSLGFVRHHHHLLAVDKPLKMFGKELFSFSFFFLSGFLQVSARAGSPIGCCSRGQTWVNRRKGHFTDGTSLRRQILVNKCSLNLSCCLFTEWKPFLY